MLWKKEAQGLAGGGGSLHNYKPMALLPVRPKLTKLVNAEDSVHQ